MNDIVFLRLTIDEGYALVKLSAIEVVVDDLGGGSTIAMSGGEHVIVAESTGTVEDRLVELVDLANNPEA